MKLLQDFDTTTEMIGKKVTYCGDNRSELEGLVGEVVTTSRNGLSAGVQFADSVATMWGKYAGQDGLVWAADWAWEVAEPEPIAEPGPYDGPHGKALEAIDNELIALGKRQLELTAARKVLESL